MPRSCHAHVTLAIWLDKRTRRRLPSPAAPTPAPPLTGSAHTFRGSTRRQRPRRRLPSPAAPTRSGGHPADSRCSQRAQHTGTFNGCGIPKPAVMHHGHQIRGAHQPYLFTPHLRAQTWEYFYHMAKPLSLCNLNAVCHRRWMPRVNRHGVYAYAAACSISICSRMQSM